MAMSKLNMILLAAAVLFALVLISLPDGTMQAMQRSFLSVVSPVVKTSSSVGEQIDAMGRGLKTLDELERENRELSAQNRQLRAINQTLRELEAENNRLRAALGYRERSVFELVPARVLSRDASSWWNTVKLDRGFAEGVDGDMPVLTEEGLVGKVTTSARGMSIAVLLTDETCRVAARVEGTNETGIVSGQRVSGSAKPELVLNFLSRNADLQPGTKVYTAGVSGAVFPSGILIGTVKEFRTRELDGQAILEPAVDFAALEDVFVVLGIK